MPLDILGRTRATMELLESILSSKPYVVDFVYNVGILGDVPKLK